MVSAVVSAVVSTVINRESALVSAGIDRESAVVSAERRPKAAHPLAETSGRRGAMTHADHARKPKPTSRTRRSVGAGAGAGRGPARRFFRWKLERLAVRCVEAASPLDLYKPPTNLSLPLLT